MKQRILMVFSFAGLAGLILFGFNNCDGYSETPSNAMLNSVSCIDASCDAEGLELASDILSKTISIPPNTNTFVISGSCLPGSYTETIITWKISRNNQELINTVTAGGEGYYTNCQQGRYQLNVKVPCPGITAGALGCFGITNNADLNVEIFGVKNGSIEIATERSLAQIKLTLIPGN